MQWAAIFTYSNHMFNISPSRWADLSSSSLLIECRETSEVRGWKWSGASLELETHQLVCVLQPGEMTERNRDISHDSPQKPLPHIQNLQSRLLHILSINISRLPFAWFNETLVINHLKIISNYLHMTCKIYHFLLALCWWHCDVILS